MSKITGCDVSASPSISSMLQHSNNNFNSAMEPSKQDLVFSKTSELNTQEEVEVFYVGQNVVCPSHGVGKLTGVEKNVYAGVEVSLYVVMFEKENLVIRLPVDSARLRRISSHTQVIEAINTLKTKKHVVKGKWDKRALFYNNKMAAAKLLDIAEIVRDLYSASGMQRSYSERKIYDDAFSKIVREVACVTGVAIEKVMSLTEKILVLHYFIFTVSVEKFQ